MRKIRKALLVSISTLLLLASMALHVSAQRTDPNSPRPTPTPTPVPAVKPLRTLNPNQIGGMLSQKMNHYGIQDAPKEENGYYVCSYSFTDRGNPNDQLNLPRNRPILVSARFGSFADEALNETLALQPWFGPGNPQPPSGARRALDGSRQIEITDDQPHVNVDFEIVYRATRVRP